jgi:hypothetical protein
VYQAPGNASPLVAALWLAWASAEWISPRGLVSSFCFLADHSGGWSGTQVGRGQKRRRVPEPAVLANEICYAFPNSSVLFPVVDDPQTDIFHKRVSDHERQSGDSLIALYEKDRV